jgi:hypothetical protein
MNLIELVEAGDLAGVVRELGTLTPDQRAAHAAPLAARWEGMVQTNGWYRLSPEERAPQAAAELGCQVTPATAAAWLRKRDGTLVGGGWMVDVADLYPEAWREDLVTRLAGQAKPETRDRSHWFVLAEHIVRDTGIPVPATDCFIEAWLHDRENRGPRPAYVLGGAEGASFLERLRKDDFTPTLLPLALERPGVFLGRDGHCSRRSVLIGLAAEGVIDRDALIRRVLAGLGNYDAPWEAATGALTELALTPAEHARLASDRAAVVDRILGRLFQDGTRRQTAPVLALLHAMAATPAENAVVARDYLALLDRSLPVASYAQEVLTGLDEAGLLESDVLTEMCERVLLRPEKKLVRAQLSWLDQAIRRDPAHADGLLAGMAVAFENRDAALQDGALTAVARHLKAAGGPVVSQLRTAATRLDPGLSARAAELLGTPGDAVTGVTGHPADILPPVPVPRPVPGPIATAAEVAQEVAAVIADDRDVVAFERALDGLVRHARLDRTALAEALAPVVRRTPRERLDCTQADIYDVARAVRGDEPREGAIIYDAPRLVRGLEARGGAIPPRRDGPIEPPEAVVLGWRHPCDPSLAGSMLIARLTEAMDVIESGTQPFLLAVPTLATGALDAAVLVERMTELEGLGVAPAPVDLAQALLRVTPAPAEQVLRAAGKLRSDAGQRLARWLREGGLPHQDSTRKRSGEWWTPACPGLVLDPPLPPAAAALVGPYQQRKTGLGEPAAPFWVAQLPHHREEVMAREYIASRASGGRSRTRVLPFVAESGGPAGYAVHFSLAFDMNVDPDATMDAMLVLAARGQLDAGQLGQQVEQLIRHKYLEPNRACSALRAAAETGAPATVWSVLEASLPGLLRDTPARGAGAFLSLAAACASRCGAKGQIPEVVAVAERTGSSQVVKNARLLRDALR